MLVSAAHDQDTPAVSPVRAQACQLGQELRHGQDRGHQGQQAEHGVHR